MRPKWFEWFPPLIPHVVRQSLRAQYPGYRIVGFVAGETIPQDRRRGDLYHNCRGLGGWAILRPESDS